jgi:hypothetical protein
VLGWSSVAKWVIVAVELVMVVYALTLLPTKLVISDEGISQQQLFTKLSLSRSDIAEWRYIRVTQFEDFWILDNFGRKHHLKRWLIFGKQRSQQLAEALRQKGVVGREEYDT